MKSIFITIMIALTAKGIPACNASVKPCEVYSTFDDEVVMEDSKGNLWGVEGFCGRIAKGNRYLVLFNNNSTESIYDDEIVEIYDLGEENRDEVQC